MLDKVISRISNDFINEALNSPNLLEDMASMEKYMAESYSGRIFVELLQNADDCNSRHILLSEYNKDMIFANDGRPFDENDVIAISRSGASSKERGTTIGYRGIGFKSTTYLTNEIVIYSDDSYFTFSKPVCSRVLNKDDSKIPTIRIPFPVEVINEGLDAYIQSLKQQGYTTVFIFKNAKISDFTQELEGISNGYFLFLNHITKCIIDIKNHHRIFEVERKIVHEDEMITFLGTLQETWYVIKSKNAAVAFKYENNMIVPCEEEHSVYHCYLPTFDKVAFPLKVNGDFSTDPSRKHLTSDEKTKNAIDAVADLLFEILCRIFSDSDKRLLGNIFSILLKANAFSSNNSLLKERLKERLTIRKWIEINNQTKISAKDYKILPDWLEDSEKAIIRQNSQLVKAFSMHSSVYKNIINADNFLSTFSISKYSIEDLINVLEDRNFVASINQETYGKMLGNIIKNGRLGQLINEKNYCYNRIYINTNKGICTFGELAKNHDAIISNDIKNTINQIAGADDIEWFCNKVSIKLLREDKKVPESTTVRISKTVRPTVSKWNSAEQQCVDLEKFFGNDAVNVSKQNLGYDVESTTPNGERKYIEVKLLSGNDAPFSITNNEFTAAHQYGEQYYLCLITQNDKNAKVLYIRNPVKNLSFEKRIRQWEWYCDQYHGEEYSMNII